MDRGHRWSKSPGFFSLDRYFYFQRAGGDGQFVLGFRAGLVNDERIGPHGPDGVKERIALAGAELDLVVAL